MSRFYLLACLLLFCTIAAAAPRLELNGVEGKIEENIRNHIGSVADLSKQRPRLLKQKLTSAITDATQALGYYETKFDYRQQDEVLTIDVELGPPVLWATSDIAITGAAADLRAVHKVESESPIVVDAVMDHQSYERLKQRLLEACQENGFLDARFSENQLRIDVEQHRATAILHIDSGERYRFAAAQFSGSSLDQELLQHLSPIEAGSYYSKETLSKLQRNLQDSRYFQEMNVRTEKLPDHMLAVNVQLGDAPRHQFSIGAGYGTDSGPRGKFRWERPLITSQGHKLTTELSVSKPEQNLDFVYQIPLDSPLDRSLNLTSSWKSKVVEDTDSRVGTIGFFFSDRYHETLVANYGATFNDESYQQGSADRKHVQYVMPGINFTQLVIPPGVDPLSGYKAWFDLRASAQPLGADTDFVRSNAGYKQIFNPFGKQLLIARVELGAINTDDIDEIPATQRFFTGGDQTVRGYDFESLAPRDANDELIGGKFLNVASVEYSIKVAEQWRAALFTDAGRAYNHGDEPWHKSVGIGARWLSPVGQIRVDIAFPVNDEVTGWRLHIFMGPPL
jgi:translocation and assembly module TamA